MEVKLSEIGAESFQPQIYRGICKSGVMPHIQAETDIQMPQSFKQFTEKFRVMLKHIFQHQTAALLSSPKSEPGPGFHTVFEPKVFDKTIPMQIIAGMADNGLRVEGLHHAKGLLESPPRQSPHIRVGRSRCQVHKRRVHGDGKAFVTQFPAHIAENGRIDLFQDQGIQPHLRIDTVCREQSEIRFAEHSKGDINLHASNDWAQHLKPFHFIDIKSFSFVKFHFFIHGNVRRERKNLSSFPLSFVRVCFAVEAFWLHLKQNA